MKISKTSSSKKIILILIFVLLLNFILPNTSKASDILSALQSGLCSIIYNIEFGTMKLLNNLFCSDENDINNIDVDKILLTPENIIKGNFELFNANMFETIEDTTPDDTTGENSPPYDKGSAIDAKKNLLDMVSGWYYALRNLALIALLVVLVYIAIRMITSSVAKDKEKYKSMLKDWMVAMCLVVIMHYIMVFALGLSNEITKALSRITEM